MSVDCNPPSGIIVGADTGVEALERPLICSQSLGAADDDVGGDRGLQVEVDGSGEDDIDVTGEDHVGVMPDLRFFTGSSPSPHSKAELSRNSKATVADGEGFPAIANSWG